MKKIIAIILLIISFSLCGCTNNEPLVINTFDSYEDIRNVVAEKCVMQMSVNTNSKYTTTGKGSLEFKIDRPSFGTTNSWHTSSFVDSIDKACPSLSFTATSSFNLLSEINAYNIDIYNANSYKTNVYLIGYNNRNEIIYISNALLNQGSNHVEFSVNPLFYSNFTDRIRKLTLSFVDFNANSLYYVDNFYVDTQVQAPAEYSAPYGEMLSFDSVNDLNYVKGISYTEMPVTTYAISSNENYIKKGKSLAISLFPYDGNDTTDSDELSNKGSGISINPLLFNDNFALANTLVFNAKTSAVKGKIINVTVNDGIKTETQSFDVTNEWAQISFTSKNGIQFSAIKSIEITVNTTGNDEESVVYLDELRYE